LRSKFQTVAEKTAENFRGYFILPHLVDGLLVLWLGRWTYEREVVGLTPVWLLSGKPSRHVSNHEGQLSLPSLRGRATLAGIKMGRAHLY